MATILNRIISLRVYIRSFYATVKASETAVNIAAALLSLKAADPNIHGTIIAELKSEANSCNAHSPSYTATTTAVYVEER